VGVKGTRRAQRPVSVRGAISVLQHPLAIGELALGDLAGATPSSARSPILPRAEFVDANAVYGGGIGWVDAHLFATTRLTRDAALWMRDERLLLAATRVDVSAGTP
jgi:hypothetical protein